MTVTTAEGPTPQPEFLMKVEDLRVFFPVKRPFVQNLLSREKPVVHAVDGVSFTLRPGEIFGIVGESGSGKTTLGRTIVRLLEPTSGRIELNGRDITRLSEPRLRPLRSQMQIIFQDPHASLNPAMTIGRAIGHPLKIHGLAKTNEEARVMVLQVMREVGLSPEEQLYSKYPADLSGGQRQRAVIARAMILRPQLIVADEPVAMLDMSIRAKVLELMLDLKRRHNLTYIFITHDLATAKLVCDRIAIMYLGRIVEIGDARGVYADPKHPYTRALLQAIPVPDPEKRRKKVLPAGEVPDAVHPPAGCRFHPRCPVALSTCGWEGQDFVDYLERRRLNMEVEKLDEETLGPMKAWWAKGLVAGRNVGKDDPEALVASVRRVLTEAPTPLVEALRDVSVGNGTVRVEFRVHADLQPKELDGRVVECLLY